MNFLKRLKEILNIFIYDRQQQVLSVFQYLTFFASIVSLSILVYYYGFSLSEERSTFLINAIKIMFVIYILNYMARLFFALKSFQFLKSNILEGILIFLLLLDVVGLYFYDFELLHMLSDLIGIKNFNAFYILFIQLYIMLLVGIELVNVSPAIMNLKLKPALIPLAGFGILILIGTFLLILPEMTTQPGSMNMLDALFTSMSAACVTGLLVVDTATFFTFKGQLVILMLMQLGGIGIITFASFFVFFLKRGLGIKQQTALRDHLDEGTWYDSKRLIRQIIGYTLFLELIGIFMIHSLWPPEVVFNSWGEKLYFSIFHAVSAFCNAGFALFSNGLMEETLVGANLLHISFAILIILGALGFPAMRDIFGISNLRERLMLPWKEWKTSTTIAVYSTIVLVVGGTRLFVLLDNGRSAEGRSSTVGMVCYFLA